MPDTKDLDQATCPVDHKSREAWLAQAKAAQAAQAAKPTSQSQAQLSAHPAPQTMAQPTQSWTQSLLSYVPFASPSSPPQPSPSSNPSVSPLNTERQVSSIPRSSDPGPTSCPVNSEEETGSDQKTGNWVYPSEKMFFEAMKRKGHDAKTADMRTVVPIHNAVNEKAWKEIIEWERPYTEGTTCAGPRLHSFAADTTRMSPKARINTILGYTAPFDRHDWIIDRCGTQIEYVIDFYAGRSDGQGKPSFYLDVRPKLNSWEGVMMRAKRGVGLV